MLSLLNPSGESVFYVIVATVGVDDDRFVSREQYDFVNDNWKSIRVTY